ncbi:hypothetical protein [Leifsonia sp. NPDC058248]|uniref:hypothetical protein n=1 Tax=Leifsonia sp. NPDC058248 TaxID=3346402 RepID=UPI0036D82996
MNDDTFDYETHKDWAERVEPARRDYKPDHANGAFVVATIIAALMVLTVLGTIAVTAIQGWLG